MKLKVIHKFLPHFILKLKLLDSSYETNFNLKTSVMIEHYFG